MTNTWRGAGSATNGNAFPDTTPVQPYLTDYQVRDGDIFRTKSSAALTLDYNSTPTIGSHSRCSETASAPIGTTTRWST